MTSWQIPWGHSLSGNTAAVATGISAAHREFLADPQVAESLRSLAAFCGTKKIDLWIRASQDQFIAVRNAVAYADLSDATCSRLTQTGLREVSLKECVRHVLACAQRRTDLFPIPPNSIGEPWHYLKIAVMSAGECGIEFSNVMNEKPREKACVKLGKGSHAELDRLIQELERRGVTGVQFRQSGGGDSLDGATVSLSGPDPIEKCSIGIALERRAEIEAQVVDVIAALQRAHIAVDYSNDKGGRLTATIDVPSQSVEMRVYLNVEVAASVKVALHVNAVRARQSRRPMRT